MPLLEFEMPDITLRNRGPKLTRKSLDALAALVGAEVPADFARFLTRFNGGDATGYHFQFKRRKRYLNTFLSTKPYKSCPRSIGDLYSDCQEFIPADSLPIAFVDGSDLLLLRTKNRRHGAIDLKINADSTNDDPESGIYKLEKSFSGFLDRVEYTDPEDLDDDDYGMW